MLPQHFYLPLNKGCCFIAFWGLYFDFSICCLPEVKFIANDWLLLVSSTEMYSVKTPQVLQSYLGVCKWKAVTSCLGWALTVEYSTSEKMKTCGCLCLIFNAKHVFGNFAVCQKSFSGLNIVIVQVQVSCFRLPPATKAPRGRPSPRRGAEENGKKEAETGGSG